VSLETETAANYPNMVVLQDDQSLTVQLSRPPAKPGVSNAAFDAAKNTLSDLKQNRRRLALVERRSGDASRSLKQRLPRDGAGCADYHGPRLPLLKKVAGAFGAILIRRLFVADRSLLWMRWAGQCGAC